MVVGLLHPGEMGAALGGLLRRHGHEVLWASAGRSATTAERARAAGLADAGTAGELALRSELILSVCPPHGAEAVARSVAGFSGLYVDANAIAPATARRVAAAIESREATPPGEAAAPGGAGRPAAARFVDGGIIGPPPRDPARTRLYLSGSHAPAVAEAFAATGLETPIVPDASALKMAYAAWTKGTIALLLAIRSLARANGVDDALLAEWERSQPDLEAWSADAADTAARKGWRWIGEMEEIAAAMADARLPVGFHRAAADVFRKA